MATTLAESRKFARGAGSRLATSAYQNADDLQPEPFKTGEASGLGMVVKLAQTVLAEGARRRREKIAAAMAPADDMTSYQRQSLDLQRRRLDLSTRAEDRLANPPAKEATPRQFITPKLPVGTLKAGEPVDIDEYRRVSADERARAAQRAIADRQRTLATQRQRSSEAFRAADLELKTIHQNIEAGVAAAEDEAGRQWDAMYGRMGKASGGGFFKKNQKAAVSDSLGLHGDTNPTAGDAESVRKRAVADAGRRAKVALFARYKPQMDRLERLKTKHLGALEEAEAAGASGATEQFRAEAAARWAEAEKESAAAEEK